MTESPRLGVYLHVPFCRHRCDYCAFATWTDRHDLQAKYVQACHAHAQRVLVDDAAPTSIFVGGGTPSLLDAELLAGLIASFHPSPEAEVTVECNPDDVTPALLARYKAAGVNRLSIGVQSMDIAVLHALGRTHNPENVERAACAAHDADLAFNIDLIYGAVGESITQWEHTLDQAIALEPAHVSAYALTVESGTPLANDAARHPDDDDQATKYQIASERLVDAGFEWYEISNWARPGRRCAHNLLYWLGGDYLAIGCAAHGYRDKRRYWNIYTPERYMAAVESGIDPIAGSEVLDESERRLERLALLVRTGAGVPTDSLNPNDLAGPLGDLVTTVANVDRSWMVGDDPRLVLTERGKLLANEVSIRLR